MIIAETCSQHNSEFRCLNSILHVQLFLQQKSHQRNMLTGGGRGYDLSSCPWTSDLIYSKSYRVWNNYAIAGALWMSSQRLTQPQEVKSQSQIPERLYSWEGARNRTSCSAILLIQYFPTQCSVKHFWQLLIAESQNCVLESRLGNSSTLFPLSGVRHSHRILEFQKSV